MYNRYIPQSDGSFRRSRVAEQPTSTPPPIQQPPVAAPTPPVHQEPPASAPQSPPVPPEAPAYHPPAPPPRNYRSSNPSVSSFLKGLLPQNFDTEDLLVILLLLLMSGNNSNDQNAALLTLGIYLFL